MKSVLFLVCVGGGYDELRKKYDRRINKFLGEISKGTCFLRIVTNLEELDYIAKNCEYIKRVIKRANNENEIVFLIKNDLGKFDKNSFRCFEMPGKCNAGSVQVLRNCFDGASDFLEFAAINYSTTLIMKNIAFDRKKEDLLYKEKQLQYDILIKLFMTNFHEIKLPKDIIIYGAGNIGKCFYEKVKETCNIRCFVDKGKAGGTVSGIPVVELERVDYSDDFCFVVTAVYDFQNIYEDIISKNVNARIISLQEILA